MGGRVLETGAEVGSKLLEVGAEGVGAAGRFGVKAFGRAKSMFGKSTQPQLEGKEESR